MQNFDWSAFTLRILVKANIQDVYNAWSTASGLQRWYTKSATHYNNDKRAIGADEPAQTGFFYSWGWYLNEGLENGKFILANGRDRLQFTFAGDCMVDVRLSEKLGEYTQVELQMKNIPTDELSKQEIRLACHASWSFFLVNLKSICEGGIDLRNKDERVHPMVNN